MKARTLSINNQLFWKAPDDLGNISDFVELNVEDFQLSHLQKFSRHLFEMIVAYPKAADLRAETEI